MSLIAEYRATEDAIKELQARLESLKGDENLQKDMDFEKKLRDLMGKHSKSLRDIISMLDPDSLKRGLKPAATAPKQGAGSRAPRKVKQYKNPHSGEVLETKGGNHKTLKDWKAQYGGDVVESWSTTLDAA